MYKKRKEVKVISRIDKPLLIVILILTSLGLIAVADASAPAAIKNFSDKYYFSRQQLMWAIGGIISMFILSQVNYKFWSKIATPLFLLSVFLLLIVLIPGIGTKVYGARRWILLGITSFQPSELAKLSLAIFFAKVSESNKKIASFFFPLLLVTTLIMLQPDLGTTLILIAIGLSQIFISGANIKYFLVALSAGAVGSGLLILFSDYRRDRLLTFLQQTTDPLGKGYHIRQILFALGSGGLWGVGLGQSRQKYLYLPETATDSIFAVIAEEIGFIGSVILIGFFVYFIFRGLRIVSRAPDTFSKVLGAGIIAWLGFQIILNIGSMVALVPLTGVPLPLFSYGGTALVMILSACGILLNISKYAHDDNR